MKSATCQKDQNSRIERLAEQIYIRMCVTSHNGFDASHYVKKSYELAKVFYSHLTELTGEADKQIEVETSPHRRKKSV